MMNCFQILSYHSTAKHQYYMMMIIMFCFGLNSCSTLTSEIRNEGMVNFIYIEHDSSGSSFVLKYNGENKLLNVNKNDSDEFEISHLGYHAMQINVDCVGNLINDEIVYVLSLDKKYYGQGIFIHRNTANWTISHSEPIRFKIFNDKDEALSALKNQILNSSGVLSKDSYYKKNIQRIIKEHQKNKKNAIKEIRESIKRYNIGNYKDQDVYFPSNITFKGKRIPAMGQFK